jgi:hypothetical protein
MSHFNYTEYLKNNPLLKEEETLLTESIEVNEENDLEAELMADLDESLLEVEEVEEAEEEETEEVEDIEIEDAPTQPKPAGLTQEEQDIQNSLKIAFDSASAIGDDKLADQIGNTITMFTRTHIVNR